MNENEKELDQLAKEVDEDIKFELNQLQILKQGLDKLHAELIDGNNKYAAAYLGVDIDRLQEVIESYTKPLKTDEKTIDDSRVCRMD